ncbi:hypothetical protein GUJ93_ZPchr0013g35661 [Zizania palustris]|uniref:Uncharacterized protein n=1 Tax=Zizania palustris TaxID=103762 RepID=A0A8J5WXY7_ZIZPA|nr:hypothetical protein GUJ93_ZPchr0013g35661 [Zizania palustris]
MAVGYSWVGSGTGASTEWPALHSGLQASPGVRPPPPPRAWTKPDQAAGGERARHGDSDAVGSIGADSLHGPW